jgi:hypothetical protein
VIISVSFVCTLSLFIDVMNRFNKVANIEGNRVYISAMKTTMSMATYFMATNYKSLATMLDLPKSLGRDRA